MFPPSIHKLYNVRIVFSFWFKQPTLVYSWRYYDPFLKSKCFRFNTNLKVETKNQTLQHVAFLFPDANVNCHYQRILVQLKETFLYWNTINFFQMYERERIQNIKYVPTLNPQIVQCPNSVFHFIQTAFLSLKL